jgi:hypothetical protein
MVEKYKHETSEPPRNPGNLWKFKNADEGVLFLYFEEMLT